MDGDSWGVLVSRPPKIQPEGGCPVMVGHPTFNQIISNPHSNSEDKDMDKDL